MIFDSFNDFGKKKEKKKRKKGKKISKWEKKSVKMADLEAVLADVSYLMAMEKSKCTPAARASKKIILPDPR